MTQRSDKALRKRILAGSQEACADLIGQYHAPIYRLLVHLCRDAHMAEDLAQETFLAAWKNIGSFKSASSLGTWLHGIAYRKFIDAHRRSERTVASGAAVPLEQVQSSTPDPYASALASDESRRLYQQLGRQTPRDRDVIVLHYLQGLSYRELAEVLGQPTGTVKWRTREALENLRRALEEKTAQ